MGPIEAVIEGTLKTDGTLELDERPNLPAGRVTVVLRRPSDVAVPSDDPFWQRMQKLWAIPTSAGNATDGGANSLAEVARTREEWHEHQSAIESLQGGDRKEPSA